MADQEPGTYRPRRAWVDPEAKPDAPEAKPDVEPSPPAPGAAGAGGPAAPDDEDAPKPLYRDEVGGPGSGPAVPASTSGAPGDPAEPTRVRPINLTPRKPRVRDEDATTILPRTSTGSRRALGQAAAYDEDDDLDEGHERKPLGPRTRMALLVAGVAAVVVIGLAVAYAVLGVQTPTTGTAPSSGPTTAGSSASTSPSAGPLLSAGLLLGLDQARVVDPKSTWKVSLDQPTPGADDPAATCLGGDPVEGQPTARQTALRVLTGNGKNAPGLLHQAAAYASPEEAAQAFAVAAKALGGCANPAGAYIASGRTVTGLGDQATGEVVMVQNGSKVQAHSMVLSRTGRVVNVVDASQPDKALSLDKVAQAAGAAVKAQCTAAGGDCGSSPSVQDGPPPLGGDEPGFLAAGDLPPAGATPSTWVGTPTELPPDDFVGSQCESVNWSTIAAENKTSRVYLLQDSTEPTFGLNEIVLTLKDEKAAGKLVDKIRDDWTGCAKRKLTATVTKPAAVESSGADNTKVSGYTALVAQKSVDGTKKYRVGIVAAGAKVTYTFLNPIGDYDVQPAQWDTVALRAGERTTQVN